MFAKPLVLAIALLSLGTISVAKDTRTGTGSGDGVKVCNCDGTAPITGANVPHSKVVPVTITATDGKPAGNTGGQSTGQTGTAFSGQTIPVGKCLNVRYTFECSTIEGGSWVCWVESFTLVTTDCPPADEEEGDD